MFPQYIYIDLQRNLVARLLQEHFIKRFPAQNMFTFIFCDVSIRFLVKNIFFIATL